MIKHSLSRLLKKTFIELIVMQQKDNDRSRKCYGIGEGVGGKNSFKD
jgi:hypothetical protein